MIDFWGQIISIDIFAFNYIMGKYKLKARIIESKVKIYKESHISYPIEVDGIKFSKITGMERELSAEIASMRIRSGINIENLSIRFVFNPLFVMEVDSPPGYYILKPERKISDFQSLIGVQYTALGRSDFFFDLTKHHQTLIAAISGHGKSKLLESILSGLYLTPPSKLVFDVLDFKNDLKTGERVQNHITEISELNDYIGFISSEKEIRKHEERRKRLIVIDEAAEIPKEYDAEIASIMKLGRSIGMNVILATQHPTAEQIGKQVARSFTHRIVGRVENSTSSKWATGISDAGAETLLRPGAFLFCHGSDVRRIQVFYE